MRYWSRYGHVLIVAILFFTLFDFSHSGSKRKKGNSKKDPSTSAVKSESIDDSIDISFEFNPESTKSLSYPCLYKSIDTDQNPVVINKNIIKDLKRCKDEFDEIIKKRLTQLGLVGDALRDWLDLADKLLLDQNVITKLKGDIRKDQELSSAFVKTFESKNEVTLARINRQKDEDDMKELHGNGDEESTSASYASLQEDSSDAEAQKEALDSLDEIIFSIRDQLYFQGFHFGTGICENITQKPIGDIINRINIMINGLSRTNAKDTFEYELYFSVGGDGKRHLVGRMYFLYSVCRQFQSYEGFVKSYYIGELENIKRSKVTRKRWIQSVLSLFLDDGPLNIFPVVDNEHESISDEFDKSMNLDDESSSIKEPSSSKQEDEEESEDDDSCNSWELRRLGEILQYLKDMKSDSDYLKLVTYTNSIASNILRECLDKFEPHISAELHPIIDDELFIRAQYYMKLVTDYVMKRDRKNIHASLLEVLSVRAKGINDIEKELFLNNNSPDNKIDMIEAYRTGKGMCDLFESLDWIFLMNFDNYILESFELMTELYRYEGFKPKFRCDIIEIYNLWLVCGQILLLPLK